MEWFSYYSRNFHIGIRPKVEKRARELKVDVVLRIKDEEIRVSGNPVDDQGLQVGSEVADYFIRVEQGNAPCRQENAVKVCSFHSLRNPTELPTPQAQIESPCSCQKKHATKGDLSDTRNRDPGFRAPMTIGGPYTIEEDVAIALYQETHPYNKWTREDYWAIFLDWVSFLKRIRHIHPNGICSSLQQEGQQLHTPTQQSDGENISSQ
jgi:hypothetical protein